VFPIFQFLCIRIKFLVTCGCAHKALTSEAKKWVWRLEVGAEDGNQTASGLRTLLDGRELTPRAGEVSDI